MREGSATQRNARSLSKQHLRLWLQMLRATGHVEAIVREGMRDKLGTTLPRFDVMAALERAPAGLTMTALSRALKVSNGNVTGIVDRLVKERLVVRIPNAQDRRATHVALTKRGREKFAEMATIHEQWIDEMLAGFGERDSAALIELLARVVPREASKQGD
jgi:DNA-binding MarR family transcriptional regulator